MSFVYILRVEKCKFYVGKTSKQEFRAEQYFDLCGSAWTKKYKSVSIIEVIPNCDEYNHTEKCVLNNVIDGGFYETMLNNNKLTKESIVVNMHDTLDKSNSCFRCGRRGHYVANCYAMTHINGYYRLTKK